MKHIELNGEIYAYETDGSQDALVESALENGGTLLTDDQLAALLAPTLTQVKINQCAVMEASYSAALGAPIGYMSTTFQADDYSRTVLNETLTASGGALPSGFQWYDINNTGVVMTYPQLLGLAGAILMRGQPLFVHKQTKKAAINAAVTVAEVQAITW